MTDATFAAFTLDLTLTGPSPLVVLRAESGDEIEVGGGTCPLVIPDGAASLHVERLLDSVTARFDAGDPTPCRTPLVPEARVAIGLRGADGVTSSAKDLIVKRGTP